MTKMVFTVIVKNGWTPISCNHSKIGIKRFYCRLLSPNNSDKYATSVDPDHIAPIVKIDHTQRTYAISFFHICLGFCQD